MLQQSPMMRSIAFLLVLSGLLVVGLLGANEEGSKGGGIVDASQLQLTSGAHNGGGGGELTLTKDADRIMVDSGDHPVSIKNRREIVSSKFHRVRLIVIYIHIVVAMTSYQTIYFKASESRNC